jgi:predicted membrane protein
MVLFFSLLLQRFLSFDLKHVLCNAVFINAELFSMIPKNTKQNQKKAVKLRKKSYLYKKIV